MGGSQRPLLGPPNFGSHSRPRPPPPCPPLSSYISGGRGDGGVPNAFCAPPRPRSLPYKRRPAHVSRRRASCVTQGRCQSRFLLACPSHLLCSSPKPQPPSPPSPPPWVLTHPTAFSRLSGFPHGRGGDVLFICRSQRCFCWSACRGQYPGLLTAPHPCPVPPPPCTSSLGAPTGGRGGRAQRSFPRRSNRLELKSGFQRPLPLPLLCLPTCPLPPKRQTCLFPRLPSRA